MSSSAPFQPEYRLLELDGIRGIAILLVIWHQVGCTGARVTEGIFLQVYQLLLNSGWIGVQLFFVLSGFLITGILMDSKDKPNALSHFYVRRFLRIFPLYYVSLCLCFFLPIIIGVNDIRFTTAYDHQIWYWFYLSNWVSPLVDSIGLPHLWSLAVEEQFYLVWPFFVFFLPRRRLLLSCGFIIVLALGFRYLVATQCFDLPHQSAYTFTIARADALIIGGLLAILMRDEGRFPKLLKYLPFTSIVLATTIIAQISVHHNFAAEGEIYAFANQTIVALLFACLILSAISQQATKTSSLIKYFLKNQPLRVVAKYSYAMYVFHLPVLWFWFDHFAPNMIEMSPWQTFLTINLNCLAVTLICLACARISWIVLENPFLKLKEKLPPPDQWPLLYKAR